MSKPPKYWSRAKRILSKKDKVMKKLITNYKDGSLVTRNDVFFSLCKSIIGQQISVAAANSVFIKFKKKCKNKINARTVNKLSFSSLKSCGLSKQKVNGIKDLAKRTLNKTFKPGIETLEVKYFDYKDIPWKLLAFPSVTYALKKIGKFPKNLPIFHTFNKD